MLLSSLFVARNSLPLAAATSGSSEPYLKVRPDNEWMTAVVLGSCFWMASNKAERCREVAMAVWKWRVEEK